MSTRNKEKGHILIVTMVLLGLGAVVAVGSLDMTALMSKTVASKKIRTVQVNQAEAGVQEALSWLRMHSQQLISPFRREEFYTHFYRTDATVGANDTGNFTVPTYVKLANTKDSALLVVDDKYQTAAFPETWDITTNTAFDAVGSFTSNQFPNVKIRITLVNALADDESLDYGPPPAATPDTDFYPIYRVDAITADDKGSHFYAIISGSSNHIFDMGVYGQDYLEIRQPCDSYKSKDGSYSNGSKRAYCRAGSNSTSAVHKNEEIYGSLQTNGTIDAEPPYGGDTCADFKPNCPNKGETCAGEDCGVPLLEIFKDWEHYCPTGTSQAKPTIPGSRELVLASSDPKDSCFELLDLKSEGTVTLKTASSPYYFKEINFGKQDLRFDPDDSNDTIEVYVETITGGKINGGQTINVDGNPTNVKIYYLGSDPLTINGNSAISAGIVAPRASVSLTGNADYFGALLAKELTLSGSGSIHYDESLGGSGMISDMQYKIHEISQYYR